MFGWNKKKKFKPAEPDRSTLVPRIKTNQFTRALEGMEIPETSCRLPNRWPPT